MNDILDVFWDILRYKQDSQDFISLLEVDAYTRLFDVSIHPYLLDLIIQLERHYVMEINKEIKLRSE
jgi:hypothetical protein